ncbi:hypothetical protein OH77DRAFT_1514062 [Trametes cingulata]|nr:hypothetical protein OH77DRAFT_1514062 [Trametes cingulata]
MPETLEEKRARLAKHAAEQAQLAEEIRLAEEAAKREAEAAEARRKAAEEAERRKAAEGQQSGGAQKRAIELSSDEEEEESPRKKRARKRQETAKGKGKAADDGPPVESRAHTGCTFGGKPSTGPVSEVRAGPVAGPSAPALQEAVWSADPAPAHLMTGEELLRTLLVEVQGLRVQLRDDLGAARTEIRSLRTAVNSMRDDRDFQKLRIDAIMEYMANQERDVEDGEAEWVPSDSDLSEAEDGEPEDAGSGEEGGGPAGEGGEAGGPAGEGGEAGGPAGGREETGTASGEGAGEGEAAE